MGFEKWVESAKKDLGEAVGSGVHNSEIWGGGIARSHKAELLPYYLQYKMLDSNQKLVYATWGLAIVTILLSGLTIYLQYFNK